MKVKEIQQYIITFINNKLDEKLTLEDLENEDISNELLCDFDVEIARESYKWLDKLIVVKKIGDKYFQYGWYAGNDNAYNNFEFNWSTIKEVEPYEEIVTVTKYIEV